MTIYREKLTRKEQDKLFSSITENKIKCPHCGHTMLFSKVDRVICDYCKHWVYKNDKARFKYKMKEEMIKNGKRA